MKRTLGALLALVMLLSLVLTGCVAADGTASTEGATSSGSMIYTIVMFAVLIGVFYFLLIRPENKKKKALNEMRTSLEVGDDITTIGGVVGTIVSIKDDLITIETSADRVRMEFARWAISTKGTQTTNN